MKQRERVEDVTKPPGACTGVGKVLDPRRDVRSRAGDGPEGQVALMNTRPQINQAGLEKHCECEPLRHRELC